MGMRIRGFVSYSTHDRRKAAEVKKVLAGLGVDAFMAHDDIRVSQEWRDTILVELAAMEIFVPLLSEAFKSSDWASQEVGFAVARPDVLILPVCLDQTRPYGFIAAFQGHLLCDPIDPEIFRRPLAARFPRVIIAIMIDALSDARSWRGAEALFQPLLPYLAELTSGEATRLAEVSTRNGEIWFAASCSNKYLPEFVAKNRHHIPPEVLRPLEYQLEHGTWYNKEA